MRLIDADKLIKIIDKTFYTTDRRYLNDLEYGFNNGLNKAIELIEEQPTAYDINSVVEKLKKESYQEFCDSERIVDLKDAIEIIKRGGMFKYDKEVSNKAIDDVTEKYFDAIENILHEKDLCLTLNQAFSIYSRIMMSCNKIKIAEKLKK